jgi:hypothetical protein
MRAARCARLLGAAVAIGAVVAAGSARPAVAAPAGSPLAGLTANQIAARALHDLTAASSVRFTVSGKEAGVKISDSITLTRTACDGVISMSMFGSFRFVQIGKTGWMLLTRQFLKQAGYSQAQITRYAGKWVKNDPMTDSDTSQICAVKQFSHGFPAKGWTKGPVTTLAGHRVVEITSKKPKVTGYILDSAKPEFVKFTGAGATITFSGYNARFKISPPPAKLVIKTLPPPPGR